MTSHTNQVAKNIFAEIDKEGITPELVYRLIDDQRFYIRTSHAILIFLIVVLFVIAGWVYLGEESVNLFGVQLEVDVHKVFLAFLIGNFSFMIQIGAFFRVIIYEKLIYASTGVLTRGQRQLLRLRGMHFTHVLMTIEGETKGLRASLRKFIAGYVRYFFFSAYGVFYYVTLAVFIFKTAQQGIPALFSLSATTPDGPAWLFLVYAVILLSLNVLSTTASMLYLDNTDYRIN